MNKTFDSMMKAMWFEKRYTTVSSDKNVEAVRQKLLDRSNVGIVKYGCTTDRDDLSLLDWLKHLQEEQLDSAVYLQAAISKLENEHT